MFSFLLFIGCKKVTEVQGLVGICPTISSVSPSDAAGNISLSSPVSAVFTEPMDPLTITIATFTVKEGNVPIAGVIAFVTAAGRESLLNIGMILIVLVLIHNTLGYLIGYWSARLFKLSERDSRTVAIEVGMQNAGLASGIAKEMGKIATVGLASAVFGPLMNITGSILASYWHRRPPKEQ